METPKEKIVKAAIKTKSGKIHQGADHESIFRYHPEIRNEIRWKGNRKVGFHKGFITDKNRFVKPPEARRIAEAAGQIDSTPTGLMDQIQRCQTLKDIRDQEKAPLYGVIAHLGGHYTVVFEGSEIRAHYQHSGSSLSVFLPFLDIPVIDLRPCANLGWTEIVREEYWPENPNLAPLQVYLEKARQNGAKVQNLTLNYLGELLTEVTKT